jgi:hypothetical protein
MSLSEQNKRELLSMATGEAEEQTRERLRQLIEKDKECRAYWKQLTEVHQALANDANRKENVPLPTGFHQRLAIRFPPLSPVREGKSWHIANYWKPAISAAFAVTLLAFLALEWFQPKRNSPTPVEPITVQTQLSSPAPNSWAALRLESIDSEGLSIASTSSPITGKIPSMNWADRETWIKELDL